MPLPLRLIFYPLFGILMLVFFFFLLFPFDGLKSRLEQEVERGLGGQFAVSVRKVSPALLIGVVLKDVQISDRAKERTPVTLERARIKFGLLPLLWGTKDLRLSIRSGRGRMSGSIAISGDATKLDFDLKHLDIGLVRLFLPPKVPLVGEADGEVSFEFYTQDPLRNSGGVKLQIQDLRLEEGGEVEGVPIPSLVLAKKNGTPSRIEISIERGNWEIRSLTLAGGDLEVEASGKVYAARRVENYRMSLRGSFQPSPQGGEAKLPLLSLVEAQKRDGKYPFSITGRLSNPSIRIGDFKVPL